jgi:hypothetical protein
MAWDQIQVNPDLTVLVPNKLHLSQTKKWTKTFPMIKPDRTFRCTSSTAASSGPSCSSGRRRSGWSCPDRTSSTSADCSNKEG